MFRETVEKVQMNTVNLRKQFDGLKMWFNQDVNTSIFYIDSDFESLSIDNEKV